MNRFSDTMLNIGSSPADDDDFDTNPLDSDLNSSPLRHGDETSTSLPDYWSNFNGLDFEFDSLDSDDEAIKTMVDPKTLDLPLAPPATRLDFANQPEIQTEGYLPSMESETSPLLVPQPEVAVGFVANLEFFMTDEHLILDALNLAAVPTAIDQQAMEDDNTSGADLGMVKPPAVNEPAPATSSRRKSSIQARNIEEEMVPKEQSILAGGKRTKRVAKKGRSSSSKKPKMHELDPENHPEAKGARYSHERRERIKQELNISRGTEAFASRLITVYKEHIALTHGVLAGFLGIPAIEGLQERLDRALAKVVGHN